MRKIFFLSVIILVIIFVIFGAAPARAFGISPSRILLTIDPGKEKNISIEVMNDETKDMIFKSKVLGARQKNDGAPEFLTGYSAAENWVTVKTDSLVVKSGQKDRVDFEIKAPVDALPGSYYLGLAVESAGTSATVGLTGQIVALLNLQVSGTVSESVKINKWELDKKNSDSRNWKFLLNIENAGPVEVYLDGVVIVRDWRGQEMFKEKLNLGNKLLPQSLRFLKPEIKIGKKLFLPGPYQIKTDINYGRTNQSVSDLIYVWYLPTWSRWTVVAVGVIVVLLFLFWLRRRKK